MSRSKPFSLTPLLLLLGQLVPSEARGQSTAPLGFDPYLTFSGNFEMGYRQTQFFERDHDAALATWDARAEGWLPPFRSEFSWGPYLRLAGIAASKDPAWENAWLAGPGAGFQIFPFSLRSLRDGEGLLATVLGPLRLYGEYNRLQYWGSENTWRPREQIRSGFEYWRAVHVNDVRPWWWAEMWFGGWYQSANEFDSHYDSWIAAGSLRGGVRVPEAGVVSMFTPYAVVESSFTDNRAYYWENRLSMGIGLRYAPRLSRKDDNLERFLNRLVIYAEYVRAVIYYRDSAIAELPRHDVRAGISFSVGNWYHD